MTTDVTHVSFPIDGRRYRKTATIRAVQMHEAFSVRSKEGADFSGKPGDWLAFGDDDSADTPHRWIISAADFAKTYVPLSLDTSRVVPGASE